MIRMRGVFSAALFCVFFFTGWEGYAQRGRNCTELLSAAEDRYEEGNLLGIESSLSSCLTEGFTSEERVNAQHLITRSYIFLDSLSVSEQAMEQFIRWDPEYIYVSNEDREFIYLHRKFRLKPIFRLRFHLGANYTLFNRALSYGVENVLSVEETVQNGVLGYVSLAIERELWAGFEISGGIQGSIRRFELNNALFDYSEYTLMETHVNIELPLLLRFYFTRKNRFQPYLYAGWVPSWLLSSSLGGVRQGGTAVNLGNVNLSNEGLRPALHHHAIGGIGFRYRLPSRRDFITVDLSYQRGLMNLSRQANRYNASQDLLFRLGYVDDNFSLDGLQIGVGYVFSFYNPKKLKKFR